MSRKGHKMKIAVFGYGTVARGFIDILKSYSGENFELLKIVAISVVVLFIFKGVFIFLQGFLMEMVGLQLLKIQEMNLFMSSRM